MKKYILIAGVNGAGKSTLYKTYGTLVFSQCVDTLAVLVVLIPNPG